MTKNDTFFTEKEDLEKIIKNNLNSIKNIKKINTGWTNIVLEAIDNNNKSYIFRFPRNNFFAKQMERDVFFANFLKTEIGLKSPNSKLFMDKDRYYSVYAKIPSVSLNERLDVLKNEKLDKIAEEIALCYYNIHKIDFNKIPSNNLVSLFDFLTELPKYDDDNYDYSIFDNLKLDKIENKVLVYGDLNIGNIILDTEDNISGFIDFSFCGISDIYLDLSRISCRVNEEFLNNILKNYEKLSGIKLDMKKIEERNYMWKYVEMDYMRYMSKNHPEIALPK